MFASCLIRNMLSVLGALKNHEIEAGNLIDFFHALWNMVEKNPLKIPSVVEKINDIVGGRVHPQKVLIVSASEQKELLGIFPVKGIAHKTLPEWESYRVEILDGGFKIGGVLGGCTFFVLVDRCNIGASGFLKVERRVLGAIKFL